MEVINFKFRDCQFRRFSITGLDAKGQVFKCAACGLCTKECPSNAIKIST